MKTNFIDDVKTHVMTVIRDDGVDRHLHFARRQGGSAYQFDIMTWPGHLMITGDMGTYVFRRVNDMFEFFTGPLNPGYWGEKLLPHIGYRKFSAEKFRERVIDQLENFWRDSDKSADVIAEHKAGVLQDVCGNNDEFWSYHAIQDWEMDDQDFDFTDFFDGGGTDDYDYSYMWSIEAIVWGIQKMRGELR